MNVIPETESTSEQSDSQSKSSRFSQIKSDSPFAWNKQVSAASGLESSAISSHSGCSSDRKETKTKNKCKDIEMYENKSMRLLSKQSRCLDMQRLTLNLQQYESNEDQRGLQDKRYKKRKQELFSKRYMIFIAVRVICYVMMIMLIFFVAESAAVVHPFFAMHSTTMTMGYVILIPQAVMMKGYRSYISSTMSQQMWLNIHYAAGVACFVLLIAGSSGSVAFVAMTTLQHFECVHSYVGVVTMFVLILTIVSGVAIVYSWNFRNVFSYELLCKMHGVLAFISVLCITTACICGVYNATQAFTITEMHCLTAGIVLITMLSNFSSIVIFVEALVTTLKSVFSRARIVSAEG